MKKINSVSSPCNKEMTSKQYSIDLLGESRLSKIQSSKLHRRSSSLMNDTVTSTHVQPT